MLSHYRTLPRPARNNSRVSLHGSDLISAYRDSALPVIRLEQAAMLKTRWLSTACPVRHHLATAPPRSSTVARMGPSEIAPHVGQGTGRGRTETKGRLDPFAAFGNGTVGCTFA